VLKFGRLFLHKIFVKIKSLSEARHWKLTSVIPATQEAEIRRTEIESQPGQIVRETLSQKNP
jgi:hypothetical protein